MAHLDPIPSTGPWWTLARRGWLYRVATAAGGLAVLYGLTTGEELAAWLGLVATLLGSGTAAANSPTRAAAPGE